MYVYVVFVNMPPWVALALSLGIGSSLRSFVEAVHLNYFLSSPPLEEKIFGAPPTRYKYDHCL